MAKLIYIAITSLDGYVEDEGGRFDWAVPDEEVHTFVNDLWEAANSPCRTTFCSGSICWPNDASATAWFTSTTAPGG
jgi:hypothetical protein